MAGRKVAMKPVAMRVLFLSQYFPPEMGAPAARVHECAREWARQGVAVTVLTGMPHHPTGILPDRYRGRLYCRERVDGIDVCRAYVYATPNRGRWRRAWSYFTFLVASAATGFFCVRKPDVVVATSPQLFAGFAGWILARLKRVPFVFEVRDLWPESIEAVKAVRSRLVLAPLYALADFLYRRADRIVLVSDSSKEALAARGVPREKMSVIKNGVDLDLFHPQPRQNRVRAEQKLDDIFVVLYIGTMGMAHGLEVVLRAAEEMKEDRKTVFLLVGEGARKEELKERGRSLPNVRVLDSCPHAQVPEYIAASDLCLVHLRQSELFRTVLPSKMFEIMGCARPVLLGVEGEARATLEKAEAGVAFPPEDGHALAEAVRKLKADPAGAARLGENGRRFVEREFSRSVLAGRYSELLSALAARTALRPAQRYEAVQRLTE